MHCTSMLYAYIMLSLHVLDKSQSQKDPVSSSASNQPIKASETYHQPITKSHTPLNYQQSTPVPHQTTYNGTDTVKSVNRSNGPILSRYIPNPPVRNPLKVTIPSSKHAQSRSTQSAAEQLGVRSPPPMRVNGGINITVSLLDSFLVCFVAAV